MRETLLQILIEGGEARSAKSSGHGVDAHFEQMIAWIAEVEVFEIAQSEREPAGHHQQEGGERDLGRDNDLAGAGASEAASDCARGPFENFIEVGARGEQSG